jgi:hypothetical protein
LAEEDKIFDDIHNQRSGITGENQMFKEFLDFFNSESGKNEIFERKVIEFFPLNSASDEANTTLKLAAADNDLNKPSSLSSGFLLSKDNTFALKYSYVNNSDLKVTLLTAENTIKQEFILYSAKLDKYFISDHQGAFSIGKYDNFRLDDFEFIAIEPRDKIRILKINNNINCLSSSNNEFNITQSKDFTFITPKSDNEIKLGVFITTKSKDSVNIKNGSIEIPNILLEDKSLLYLY